MSNPMTTAVSPLIDTAGSGSEWLARYSDSLMNVFGAPQRVLVRGEGCTVWDADGKAYLDLLGGIAVNALGHAHPFVTSAIAGQLNTLGHISNFFTSPTQVGLAEKLLQLVQARPGPRPFSPTQAPRPLKRRSSSPGATPPVAAPASLPWTAHSTAGPWAPWR